MAVKEVCNKKIPAPERKIEPWGQHICMMDSCSLEEAKNMMARCIVDTLIKGKRLQVLYTHDEMFQTHNFYWKCDLVEPMLMSITGPGVEELDGL